MNYEFFPEIIIRTPTFPISAINKSVEEFVADPYFEEALLIANPELYGMLSKKKYLENEHVRQTLTRYYNRMSFRCTPFGLFAGCSIANWGEKTELKISIKDLSRRTRLDKGFFNVLCEAIFKLPEVFLNLQVSANNTIYRSGGEYRMIERDLVQNELRITSVEENEALNFLLNLIASQDKNVSSLIRAVEEFGFSKKESLKLLRMMVDNQILIPISTRAASTKILLSDLIHLLNSIDQPSHSVIHWRKLLASVRSKMEEMDKKIIHNQVSLAATADAIASLELQQSVNKIIQVDYVNGKSVGSIDQKMKRSIQKSLDVLAKISTVGESNGVLDEFKRKFLKKYELQEVPLLEALDPDFGIDYSEGSSSFDNFLSQDFMIGSDNPNSRRKELNYNQKLVVSKYEYAISNSKNEIELTDEDIRSMENYVPTLSPTISVFFKVIGNDKIYVENAGGSSAINLFARFTDFHEGLYNVARNIAKHEQQVAGDMLLAEVIHEPESRSANVNVFPRLRAYVIPYLTEPYELQDEKILLTDLVLSLRNGQFFLRSKRLKKFVIPMISSAYNYLKGSPVFRFLGDLQNQGRTAFNFDFQRLIPEQRFYPRLYYKNVILGLAEWQIKLVDLQSNDPVQRIYHLKKYFKTRGIPAQITIHEGDNELFIDTDRHELAEIFLDHLNKRKVIYVREFLIEKDNYPVHNEHGEFLNNQMIALLYDKSKAQENTDQLLIADDQSADTRSFSLGSEWLFYKFYGGVVSCDKFLIGSIKHLISYLTRANLISQFFFIRYTDPDPHIRLRLKIKNLTDLQLVIEAVRKFTLNAEQTGQIWKIQTDTYKREIERYGVAMVDAEKVFDIDSSSILKLISVPDIFENSGVRFSVAIRLVNDLLLSFIETIDGRIYKCNAMRALLKKECSIDSSMDKKINMQYRVNQEGYFQYLHGAPSKTEAVFQYRLKKLKALSKAIERKSVEKKTPTFPDQVLGSFIHMSVNRIFSSNQKIYEYIIYDYLFKYYNKTIRTHSAKAV